jgi:ABC-type uncharacterized transport system substrate-binding protein
LKEYEVIGNVYETPELLTTHPIPALTEEEIKKDSYILVPKEIEFVYDNGNLALRFNNGKQMLLASTTDKSIFVVYDTTYYYSYPLISCKLIPCKREDLKPGDWAFGAYRDNEDFKTLYNYSLILDEKSYALVNNGANIIIGDVDCVYWYKVERV